MRNKGFATISTVLSVFLFISMGIFSFGYRYYLAKTWLEYETDKTIKEIENMQKESENKPDFPEFLYIYPNANNEDYEEYLTSDMTTHISMTTKDSPKKINDYYQQKLKQAGWIISGGLDTETNPPSVDIQTNKDPLSATIKAVKNNNITQISIKLYE